MALLGDASVILTKNNILHKTKILFEDLQATLQQQEQFNQHPLFQTCPKISRGENYLGLPYLVLDYPRNFGQEDMFAIRSFCWWGNFFSSTLQLSGRYRIQFAHRLAASAPELARRNYYVQVGPDPWAHHFEADNYQPVAAFRQEAFAAHLQGTAPIKIAAKWPLEEWPHAANTLFESWKFLLEQCGV